MALFTFAMSTLVAVYVTVGTLGLPQVPLLIQDPSIVASQDFLAEIIPKYLDLRAIRIVTGGPKETTFILEQRFDHIFYTGSPNVAKIIQKAAAKNLTPTSE